MNRFFLGFAFATCLLITSVASQYLYPDQFPCGFQLAYFDINNGVIYFYADISSHVFTINACYPSSFSPYAIKGSFLFSEQDTVGYPTVGTASLYQTGAATNPIISESVMWQKPFTQTTCNTPGTQPGFCPSTCSYQSIVTHRSILVSTYDNSYTGQQSNPLSLRFDISSGWGSGEIFYTFTINTGPCTNPATTTTTIHRKPHNPTRISLYTRSIPVYNSMK